MRTAKWTLLLLALAFCFGATAWADITVDVKMDGVYQKDKVFIGANGTHPTTIPFTLKDSEETRANCGYVIGHEEGFYIWADKNGWHARWTGNHATHIFEGKISSNEITAVNRYAYDTSDQVAVDIDDSTTENFFDAADAKNVQFKTGVGPHEDGLDIVVSSTLGDTNLAAPQAINCNSNLRGKLVPSWKNTYETTDLIAKYNVYRATSPAGTYESIGSVNASAKTRYTYADSTAVAGTRYYYRVTAVDAAGVESLKSVAVSSKVLPSPELVAPTSLDTIAGIPNFTWNAVEGAFKYELHVLRVGRVLPIWAITLREESAQPSFAFNFNGTAVQELAVNAKYTWKVIAYDRFGSVGVSDAGSFTYTGTVATVSGADAFLRTVNVTHSNNPNGKLLELAAACGNAAKVSSVIVTLPNGETKSLTRVGSTAVFSASVKDFTYLAGEYKFALTTSSNNTMTMSDMMNGEDLPLANIVAPKANDTAALPISFQWDAISGAKFYRLRIFRSTDSGVGAVLVNVPTTSTSITVGSECLSADTIYYCRVLAISDVIQEGVDNGSRSVLVKFTTGSTGGTGGTDNTGGTDGTDNTGGTGGTPTFAMSVTANRIDYLAGQDIVFHGSLIGDGTLMDVYIAIGTPSGKLLFVRRGVEGLYLTESVLPLVGSWKSESVTGPIFSLRAGGENLSEAGTYTIFAVLTTPGADVIKSENWISALSSYKITIHK